MLPSVEVKIWLALRSRVESLPLAFPVAWPAERFTPPHTGQLDPYLRIGSVSVDPQPIFIETGMPHVRAGTLIVTLVHPMRDGYGSAVYEQYAGQIAEHFADGTEMHYHDVCVSVQSQPHVQPGYEDNGYWTIPVAIRWRTVA